ncbi:MAG: DUF1064 domain-containing protein [Methylophilus sp.]|jgi:hypothetical protein
MWRLKEKTNKYKNQKTVKQNIVFDSKKEANRYQELLLMEKGGVIQHLQLQVTFELIPKQQGGIRNEQAVNYIADFVYTENGKTVVEDAKGKRTDSYITKRKLMKQMGYEITEV